jgi:hypothetical protein
VSTLVPRVSGIASTSAEIVPLYEQLGQAPRYGLYMLGQTWKLSRFLQEECPMRLAGSDEIEIVFEWNFDESPSRVITDLHWIREAKSGDKLYPQLRKLFLAAFGDQFQELVNKAELPEALDD